MFTFSATCKTEETRGKPGTIKISNHSPIRYTLFGVLSILGLVVIAHVIVCLTQRAAVRPSNTFGI